MKLKLIIPTILAVLSFSAQAELVTVSSAYELSVSDLSIPTSENSILSFNECKECDVTTARLTPATRYTVNGRNAHFDDFRQAVVHARTSEQSGVATLLHHLKSDTVVSVSVFVRLD